MLLTAMQQSRSVGVVRRPLGGWCKRPVCGLEQPSAQLTHRPELYTSEQRILKQGAERAVRVSKVDGIRTTPCVKFWAGAQLGRVFNKLESQHGPEEIPR